jgi:Xaa-Pro aminopeptidase
MVFTIEPGLYDARSAASATRTQVAVTEDGIDVLTGLSERHREPDAA